jgi:hypothetical protein
MAECPACMQKIVPNTVKCSHCGAVLDEARARQFFPDLYRDVRAVAEQTIPDPKTSKAAVK